jgi:hypothetical protein
LIPLGDDKQWRAALDDIEHAFGHTWESCYAMSQTSKAPTYLYVFQAGSFRVICPLSERRYGDYIDIFTPFGYSGLQGLAISLGFLTNGKHLLVSRGGYAGT